MNPSIHGGIATWVATGFGLSYVPWSFQKKSFRSGTGLVGSLIGLGTYFFIPQNLIREAFAIIGFLLISVVLSDIAETYLSQKDDPRIVIDEWVGMWISLFLLPRTWFTYMIALIFFRIFDVWKGFGIRKLQSLPGGWGIVIDDVLAGIYACLLSHGIYRLLRL